MDLPPSFLTTSAQAKAPASAALAWRPRGTWIVLVSLALTAPCLGEEPKRGAGVEGQLSDRAELDRIIDVYHSGQYEACVVQLEPRLSEEAEERFTDIFVIERGQLYMASCALLAGDQKRAREVLITALEKNPLMAPPDSLTFPPPVVTLFLEVRDQIQGLIAEREQQEIRRQQEVAKRARDRELARQEREKRLIELASEETLVTPNRRIVAFLPFGAGQYQNGQAALGDFFLVTELGLGAIATTSGLILANLYARGLEQTPREAESSSFEAAHAVLTVSTWTLLGVTAIGIIEANLNYQPFRTLGTRTRAVPSLNQPRAWTFLPAVTPLEGGAYLGAFGSF